MRLIAIGLFFLASAVSAEDQFALVDSVNHQDSGKSFLSFEAGDKNGSKGDVTLNGSIWHQEFTAFRDIEVTVTAEAQKAVSESDRMYSVGGYEYWSHERVFKTKNSTVLRKMLISKDGETMLGLTDDPGPLAIAAIVAGSAVALCTAQVVYNMYKCETNKPRLTIGFGKEGFICDARCE